MREDQLSITSSPRRSEVEEKLRFRLWVGETGLGNRHTVWMSMVPRWDGGPVQATWP